MLPQEPLPRRRQDGDNRNVQYMVPIYPAKNFPNMIYIYGLAQSHALSKSENIHFSEINSLDKIFEFRIYEKLSRLVHTWPEGAQLCQVKGNLYNSH